MDKTNYTFQITTSLGKKISGTFNSDVKDQFLEAFSAHDGKQKVILKGTGSFSSSNKLKRVIGIDDLIILDKNDLGYRLDELSLIRDGWLDGYGKSLDPERLDWFSDNYEKFIEIEEIETFAFPTPNGNLQLEWSNQNIESSFLVDLQNKTGDFSCIDLDDVNYENNIEINLLQN
jgi:hypothetical protein